MNAVIQHEPSAAHALTVEQIKGQVQLIQRVMRSVMKKGTHYGVIPGLDDKPTLFKPGSEALLTAFRISCEPEVDDLSTSDEFRYRVRALGRHQSTGIVMGIGIGEASTNEEKYKWRNVVCQQEFDEAPEDRRRIKWQRGSGGSTYQRNMIRTNPADLANTVLKMAKKRAQVDMTLTALGASDIFAQDLEDLPAEHLATEAPQGKAGTEAPRSNGERSTGARASLATAAQVKLIRARLDHAGIPESEYLKHTKLDSIEQTPFARVDEVLQWIAQAHDAG